MTIGERIEKGELNETIKIQEGGSFTLSLFTDIDLVEKVFEKDVKIKEARVIVYKELMSMIEFFKNNE